MAGPQVIEILNTMPKSGYNSAQRSFGIEAHWLSRYQIVWRRCRRKNPGSRHGRIPSRPRFTRLPGKRHRCRVMANPMATAAIHKPSRRWCQQIMDSADAMGGAISPPRESSRMKAAGVPTGADSPSKGVKTRAHRCTPGLTGSSAEACGRRCRYARLCAGSTYATREAAACERRRQSTILSPRHSFQGPRAFRSRRASACATAIAHGSCPGPGNPRF